MFGTERRLEGPLNNRKESLLIYLFKNDIRLYQALGFVLTWRRTVARRYRLGIIMECRIEPYRPTSLGTGDDCPLPASVRSNSDARTTHSQATEPKLDALEDTLVGLVGAAFAGQRPAELHIWAL